jgi:hypothetical protein
LAGGTRLLDLWKVCAQNPPPGQTLTPDSTAEFDLVKADEDCPGSRARC